MVIYALSVRIQVVNAKSPLLAGLSLLPMLGSVAIASTIAGAINSKRDLICPTLIVGSLFLILGTATLSTLSNVTVIEKGMYGFEVFVGLGFGLMVSTVSLGATLECELQDSSEPLYPSPSVSEPQLMLDSRRTRHNSPGARPWRQHRHCGLDSHPLNNRLLLPH